MDRKYNRVLLKLSERYLQVMRILDWITKLSGGYAKR
jgi:hypothetical protein